MHTPQRPDGELAPWTPAAAVPARPAPVAWEDPALDVGTPPRMFSPKVVLRALKRHWWQILAIWAIGSAGLMYLANSKIRPLYDATAWLEVEPAARGPLASTTGGNADFGPYLETQVLLVTSPDVLLAASLKPEVKNTKKIRMSADPEIDLRKEIAVGVPVRGTHVIQVKMTGENSGEIVAIVNAVVDSYLEKAQKWVDEATRDQLASMLTTEKNYQNTIDNLTNQVHALHRKNLENVNGAAATQAAEEDQRDAKDKAGRFEITLDQFRTLQNALLNLQIEREKAQTTVRHLEEVIKQKNGGLIMAATVSDEEIRQHVEDEFKTLPETQILLDKLKAAEDRYEKARRRARSMLDPTVKQARELVKDADQDYRDYWETIYPKLYRQAKMAATNGPPPDSTLAARENDLSLARLSVERIKVEEKLIQDRINKAAVEVKAASGEILDIKFTEQKIASITADLDQVRKHREQIEMDARQTRVKLIARAKPTRSASADNRLKAMLAAPVLMLILSCGLFIALEFKSGRVADPDELSQRIRVGVIGVVPPLPSLNAPTRALSVRGQRDEKRRVEEFVQSLDHLRVTLCAPRPGQSDRRCVLITSATGGEGKTTLAAQLAGRCANAGLMTLLIDADLRRPSLGDLLEVPEGPGFVDVLTGDVPPEAAMVVIGNAGGFHLLPAGTLGQDPSRLLHGDRLGKLIAQFRETFDMVIIDAPPVLAVPDALLLGRWTDGAVLAVRHDTSRFPLVERANRRLASVGVSVLGAVVNGCRTMESAYGSYRYTPYAAAEAPGGELEA